MGMWMEHMEHELGGGVKDTFVWASKEDLKGELRLIFTGGEPGFDKECWDG